MDLYKLMENRRSTRGFLTKKVPVEKLQLILKAGQLSPSGADQKPFVYIIVDDANLKEKIKNFCEQADKKYYKSSPAWFKQWMKNKDVSLKKDFLVDAPLLLVIASETDKPYWLESTWISIAYVILAAENEGLATLTYTPMEMGFLNDVLDLPKSLKPVAVIPVGYAKK